MYYTTLYNYVTYNTMKLLCLLYVFLCCAAISTASMICSLDSCSIECEDNEYIAIPTDNDTECCTICTSGSGASGSGINIDPLCVPCDQSCDTCYGPYNDQCYTCVGPYIVVESGTGMSGCVACDNGLVRNTTLNTVQCFDVCPDGFLLNNETMECVCPLGSFQNESSCSLCVEFCAVCMDNTTSGCIQCTNVSYNGTCQLECPSDTTERDGVCIDNGSPLFSISRVAIFAIIGVIGFLIILCAVLMTITCCYISYRENKKYDSMDLEYTGSVEGGAVKVTESFKKVTRNFSIERHTKAQTRQSNQLLGSGNSGYRESIALSLDPYHQLSVERDELNQSQDSRGNEEMTRKNITRSYPGGVKETSLTQESVYIEMSPANSRENLDEIERSVPKKRQKVGISRSFEKPRDVSVVVLSNVHTLPPGGSLMEEDEQGLYVNYEGHDDEIQEQYVDPSELLQDDSNQPVDYLSSGRFDSSHQQDDDEEQELYVDVDCPPIPMKAIVSPSAKSPFVHVTSSDDSRHETIDNQYVRITRHKPVQQDKPVPISKGRSSEDLIPPKYMNVKRNDDPRLRSVTSPDITPAPGKTPPEPIDEPLYQNVTHNENEYLYGNVDY